MSAIQCSAAFLGRILLSAIFLLSGANKFMAWEQTTQYMESKGLPAAPVLLPVAAAAEIAGGLSLLLGLWARLGAIGLIAFLVPTTAIFHGFWALEGAEQQAQMIQFLKNLAIMGGLLLVAAFGPGGCSVDRLRAGSPPSTRP
jgi:putative oxidoreductase